MHIHTTQCVVNAVAHQLRRRCSTFIPAAVHILDLYYFFLYSLLELFGWKEKKRKITVRKHRYMQSQQRFRFQMDAHCRKNAESSQQLQVRTSIEGGGRFKLSSCGSIDKSYFRAIRKIKGTYVRSMNDCWIFNATLILNPIMYLSMRRNKIVPFHSFQFASAEFIFFFRFCFFVDVRPSRPHVI